MTELKTLKDISLDRDMVSKFQDNAYDARSCGGAIGIFEDELRQEAIKWVKEDREDICCFEPITAKELLEKWIKRLDISEEDLK